MFPEKKGEQEREWERERKKRKKEAKKRKSNYSASIIINSQLVPRGIIRSRDRAGKGEQARREKREESGSFVEKLTTPLPRIARCYPSYRKNK